MNNKDLYQRRVLIDSFKWSGPFGSPQVHDIKRLKELTPLPIRSAFGDLIGISAIGGVLAGTVLGLFLGRL